MKEYLQAKLDRLNTRLSMINDDLYDMRQYHYSKDGAEIGYKYVGKFAWHKLNQRNKIKRKIRKANKQLQQIK